MSDEKIQQDPESKPSHELSETPLGASLVETEVTSDSAAGTHTPEEPEVEAQSQPAPHTDARYSMEAAMAAMDEPRSEGGGVLVVGEVVDGVVVHIDREGVMVDVGTKSEGVIKPNELSTTPYNNPEDVVSVGEHIRVFVVHPESKEGGPILSKKRADFEKAWEKLEKSFQDGETVKAMVTDRVKGGLVVDLGVRGFVPASHVGSGKIKNLDKYVGQSMAFKVIEVDRERRKVVLSNRQAAEEEREAMRKEIWTTLEEGQIKDGVVRRIADYGAFIDLGGVDGLLHVSEMSWTRINHPSDVVKPRQKLQVVVLKVNEDQGRVSLGLRQILPDPWEDIRKAYSVGDVIKVKVTRVVPFGAFVEVRSGVEGIIPNSELAIKRINKPEDVVSSGQEIEAKIVDIRAEERRMTLSLRQIEMEKVRSQEESDVRQYTQQVSTQSRTTIGDLLGGQLGELSGAFGLDKEKTAKKKKARADRLKEIEEAESMEDHEIELEEPERTDVIEMAEAHKDEAEAVAEPAESETPSEESPVEEPVDVPVEEASTDSPAEPQVEAEAAPEVEAEASAPKPEGEETTEAPVKKRASRAKKTEDNKSE